MDIKSRPAKAGETTDQFREMYQALKQTAGRLNEMAAFLHGKVGESLVREKGVRLGLAADADYDLNKVIGDAADLLQQAAYPLARAAEITSRLPRDCPWRQAAAETATNRAR